MKKLKQLFMLDPEITYLNHGSFGATPRPVFEVYQNYQRQLEKQPVLFLGRMHTQLFKEARTALGKFLNANPDDLAFIPNVTFGINVIANSISLKPGDEVLSTDHEYGACDLAWNYYCDRAGAKYVKKEISLPIQSDEQIIEQIWAGVNSKTKVLFLSHITSPSAIRFPVEKLCEKARTNGIISVIDGAHAIGQIPLDFDRITVDFYTSNCHKWALAPKGAAFLYVRHEVQQTLKPLVVSWGFGHDPSSGTGSRFLDMMQWNGTMDPSAMLTVPFGLKFMEDHDWESVRQKCHEILSFTLDGICDLTGIETIYPGSSGYFAQMGSARLPDQTDLNKLKIILYDDYKIEIPLTQQGKNKYIRVSIQGYNDFEDGNKLINALKSHLFECLE